MAVATSPLAADHASPPPGGGYGAPPSPEGGYGASPPPEGGYGASPPPEGGYGAPPLPGGGYGAPPLRLDRWDVGAMAFLLVVTLLFHWPLITPDLARRQSYPDGDFYVQFHAFASYEHDRLWAGEVPLWNPYTFGGHPFLADVQAAVFYPPSLLAILLSGPGPFSPLWLELEAMAHFYLAALFTYLFVRRLLRSGNGQMANGRRGEGVCAIVGPIVAALTFAFGGYLTGYPPLQLAILETQVWLPLILFLLDVGLSERRWPFVVGAGGAWGMALLAGHPQSAMYVLYGALLYGVYRAWRARSPWWWAALAHLAWIGIGFGLAAVHLLPAWEFMRLSVRSSATYAELAGGFGWRDLAQCLLPGAFTHWSPVYVGILPLCLAAVACGQALAAYMRRERKEGREGSDVLFWVALALGSLVLSLGGKTFVYRLFYWFVPGFNLFRSQERAIYLTSYALAVLAGYGWHWLSSGRAGRTQIRWGLWGVTALGVASVAATAVVWAVGRQQPLPAGGGSQFAAWLKRLLLWVGLTWAAWGLVRWRLWQVGATLQAIGIAGRPGRARGGAHTVWAVSAVALVMVDLGVVNMRTNLSPGPAQSRVYEGSWLAPVLEDGSLRGDGPARIANEWGLPGNGGCWLRLQDLYGASPLRLQAHKTMADALPHWRLWQLFDVRYVATWEHDCPGPFPAQRVAMRGIEWEKNTVYVHRLEEDFPRAWVVHRAQQVDDAQALALMADPGFDPFDQVLLADPVPAGFAANDPPRPAEVKEVHYEPERLVVEVNLFAAGWLVVGEWETPGWQAWVDGTRQAVYRANYGLRAVPLPEGAQRVEFRYRPSSFTLGSALSALTCAALVGLAWLAYGRRGRSR